MRFFGASAYKSLKKPNHSPAINYGHVLAPDSCYLFNQPGQITNIGRKYYRRTSTTSLFQISQIGPSIVHTSTANKHDLGIDNTILPLNSCTIVLLYRKTDATNRGSGAFGIDAVGNVFRCGVHLPFSDAKVYWDFGGSAEGSSRLSIGSLTFGPDLWVFTTGTRGMEIWQNGIKRASNAANPTRTQNNSEWKIGVHGAQPSDLAEYGFLYVYQRQLSASEVIFVSTNPFAFFAAPPTIYLDGGTAVELSSGSLWEAFGIVKKSDTSLSESSGPITSSRDTQWESLSSPVLKTEISLWESNLEIRSSNASLKESSGTVNEAKKTLWENTGGDIPAEESKVSLYESEGRVTGTDVMLYESEGRILNALASLWESTGAAGAINASLAALWESTGGVFRLNILDKFTDATLMAEKDLSEQTVYSLNIPAGTLGILSRLRLTFSAIHGEGVQTPPALGSQLFCSYTNSLAITGLDLPGAPFLHSNFAYQDLGLGIQILPFGRTYIRDIYTTTSSDNGVAISGMCYGRVCCPPKAGWTSAGFTDPQSWYGTTEPDVWCQYHEVGGYFRKVTDGKPRCGFLAYIRKGSTVYNATCYGAIIDMTDNTLKLVSWINQPLTSYGTILASTPVNPQAGDFCGITVDGYSIQGIPTYEPTFNMDLDAWVEDTNLHYVFASGEDVPGKIFAIDDMYTGAIAVGETVSGSCTSGIQWEFFYSECGLCVNSGFEGGDNPGPSQIIDYSCDRSWSALEGTDIGTPKLTATAWSSGSVTFTFSGFKRPTQKDWVIVYEASSLDRNSYAALGNHWVYTSSGTKTFANTALSSGEYTMTAPTAPGTYILRWNYAGVFGQIAESNTFVIS